jgi:hypothetical protein
MKFIFAVLFSAALNLSAASFDAPLSPSSGVALSAPTPLLHSFYIRGAGGIQFCPWDDVQRLGTSRILLGGGVATGEVGVGYVNPGGLGLELLASTLNFDGYFAVPTYRGSSRGVIDRPMMHILGLGLGAGRSLDSGNLEFKFTSFLCYRMEQMLGPKFSLGLQFGYLWAEREIAFNRNPYGPTTSLKFNYSGPNIKLTLAGWLKAPFMSEQDQRALDLRHERIRQKLFLRARRIEKRMSPAFAASLEAQEAGDRFMADGKPLPACDAYESALRSNPQSSPAWKGLGDAEHALENDKEALKAYEKALELSPKDSKLRELVEKFRAEIGKE